MARASADHWLQAGSSVTISRMTLESTTVAGGVAMAIGRAGGSVATQQLHELIRAHGGACPAAHPAHNPLPSGRARLDLDDAQGIAVFDDVYLIALMQTVPRAEISGDRHLPLA